MPWYEKLYWLWMILAVLNCVRLYFTDYRGRK